MKKIILPIFALIFSASMFAQTAGTLTVKATVAYSSPYFYAVWINNPNGTFLRTLVMYGGNSSYYKDLVNWHSQTSDNKTNAITGATASATTSYTTTWNGKNQVNSGVVTDGNYIVNIEMSSESYSPNSKFVSTSFAKGRSSVSLTPTAVSPIGSITVSWVPDFTAVQNVDMQKLYSVYPNPTVSSIFVNGIDIKEIEICSLSGKTLLLSKEQKVDVSALSKGFYLAIIRAKTGTVVNKFEKI